MEEKEIIEGGTGLPLGQIVHFDDENPEIEVDWFFLRMVITRLQSLKKHNPRYLAKNDIPRTLNYISKLKI